MVLNRFSKLIAYLILAVVLLIGAMFTSVNLEWLWYPTYFFFVFFLSFAVVLLAVPIAYWLNLVAAFFNFFIGGRVSISLYAETLQVLEKLGRVGQVNGMVAMETHLLSPNESPIFSRHRQVLKHRYLSHFIIKNFLYMLLNPPRSHSLAENLSNQIQLIYEKERLVAQGVMLWFYSFLAFSVVVAVWHFSVAFSGSSNSPGLVIESINLFAGLAFFALAVLLPVAFFSLQQARQNRAILSMCAHYILAFSAGATAKLSSEVAKQGLPLEYADVSSWMKLD